MSMKGLNIELLKFKNSFSMFVLFLSPLFFLMFAIFTALFAQGTSNKQELSPYLSLLFNLWPYFVVPIILCMACNSLINIEKKNNVFNFYKSNNWSINMMINNKIITMVIGFGIHTIIIFFISILGNLLVGGNSINPFLILVTLFLIYLSSLPLIPINFLLVKYLGVFIAIFLNLALSIFSILTLTTSKLFWLLPWSYAGRIALITLSLHPNGTLLSKSNQYYNDLFSLLVILISAIAYFFVFYLLNNKESWRL